MRNNWEIVDDEGTIYSGEENEMRDLFSEICVGDTECDYEGDLRLIEVHAIFR